MPVIIFPNTGVNNIHVNSGNSNSLRLQTDTGVALNISVGNQIPPQYIDTGLFYPITNPSGFITGIDSSIYITGAVVRPSDTGAFYPVYNPSGFITGVNLSQYSTISFSTGISGHLQNQINTLSSGNQSFLTVLPTGIEYTGVMFPTSFSSVPQVYPSLIVNSDTGYLVWPRYVGATGYTACFSDVIGQSGINLQTFATNL
jgi:hypothetical protein